MVEPDLRVGHLAQEPAVPEGLLERALAAGPEVVGRVGSDPAGPDPAAAFAVFVAFAAAAGSIASASVASAFVAFVAFVEGSSVASLGEKPRASGRGSGSPQRSIPAAYRQSRWWDGSHLVVVLLDLAEL